MFRDIQNGNRRTRRWNIFLKIFIVLFALLIVAITSAWMFPGFVESPGFLEPDSRVAVYAPESGIVNFGELEDGLSVNKGEVILVINQDWPRWNLERVRQEIGVNRKNLVFQEMILDWFLEQRSVEEQELNRLLELEKILVAATPRVNITRRQYSYDRFITSAEREQVEIEQGIAKIRQEGVALIMEKELWEQRLSKCRLPVSVSGVFYTFSALLPEAQDELLPRIGPGYYLNAGDLLGYIIPDDSIKVIIRIPQTDVARAKVGQDVLVSMTALPAWRFHPLRGRLLSVRPVASAGYFRGVVAVSSMGRTSEEIKNLYFGDLVARIRVSEASSHGWIYKLWENWAILVNSVGDY